MLVCKSRDSLSLKVGKSDHPLLQRIHQAINVANDDGSRLVATALSGGYSNWSYRVRVDKHPELCLFAKFCFEKAITPHGEVRYDLREFNGCLSCLLMCATIFAIRSHDMFVCNSRDRPASQ